MPISITYTTPINAAIFYNMPNGEAPFEAPSNTNNNRSGEAARRYMTRLLDGSLLSERGKLVFKDFGESVLDMHSKEFLYKFKYSNGKLFMNEQNIALTARTAYRDFLNYFDWNYFDNCQVGHLKKCLKGVAAKTADNGVCVGSFNSLHTFLARSEIG